jgi:ABC-2 type transport system ATP-binding protein
VIYLDEPTSALDPSAAKTVRDFVATLRDAGRSIVVCTHNLDEAERLCDRIAIIHGTLLLVDTPARLRRGGRAATVRVELSGARHADSFVELLAPLPFVLGARANDGRLEVEVGDPRGDNPELVRTLVEAGARIVSVTEEAATLEEVYLELFGERAERDGGEPAAPTETA